MDNKTTTIVEAKDDDYLKNWNFNIGDEISFTPENMRTQTGCIIDEFPYGLLCLSDSGVHFYVSKQAIYCGDGKIKKIYG